MGGKSVSRRSVLESSALGIGSVISTDAAAASNSKNINQLSITSNVSDVEVMSKRVVDIRMTSDILNTDEKDLPRSAYDSLFPAVYSTESAGYVVTDFNLPQLSAQNIVKTPGSIKGYGRKSAEITHNLYLRSWFNSRECEILNSDSPVKYAIDFADNTVSTDLSTHTFTEGNIARIELPKEIVDNITSYKQIKVEGRRNDELKRFVPGGTETVTVIPILHVLDRGQIPIYNIPGGMILPDQMPGSKVIKNLLVGDGIDVKELDRVSVIGGDSL
ncbi:MAG: hypothetical protein ABEJ42_05495 [Halobacteriaceae archaeon]